MEKKEDISNNDLISAVKKINFNKLFIQRHLWLFIYNIDQNQSK